MKKVPFDQLVKGDEYYIEYNASIDPANPRIIKKRAKFDKYIIVYSDDDDDELKIANFTDFTPIPNATGKSYQSNATGFTEDAEFFIPENDALMLKSVINQRPNSTIANLMDLKYGGNKRKNKKATRKSKFSKKRKTRKI
jgi:AICAR transformylase/IMP cyclohydrolase PurH